MHLVKSGFDKTCKYDSLIFLTSKFISDGKKNPPSPEGNRGCETDQSVHFAIPRRAWIFGAN